jgi:hypothetical protein
MFDDMEKDVFELEEERQEKETKKKKQNQDLENNRFAIMNMIGKNIFGEPIENKE